MPTYEYLCEGCGHNFDEFQSMSAEPLKKCPECKKNKLKRIIGGGAAIIFKGSGFYETDYRSDSYKQEAKKEKESASTDTSSKSDTKDTSSTTTGSPKSESKGKSSKSNE